MNKREFLGGAGAMAALFGSGAWARWSAFEPQQLARAEDFWAQLRGRYRLREDYINLENGYYSMMAEPVLEAFVERVREVNFEAARFFRTRADAERLETRAEAMSREVRLKRDRGFRATLKQNSLIPAEAA